MEPFESLVTTNSQTQITQDLPLLEESRQKFLRFSLGSSESGLLALEKISEIFRVNITEILPVPEMPGCVVGIYNWRGKMLWLIDLDHLVDYPPLSHQGRELNSMMVMVIQVNGQFLGLIVQSVADIELYDIEQLQPADVGLFPSQLLPFIEGYFPSANGTVLDPEAIARFPLWQVHRG